MKSDKSVNESPAREILLQSKYLAPTGSLKLSSKNKQEPQREHIRVVEPDEKRTQFRLSPFIAPSGEQITPNTHQYAPVFHQQSYNHDSPCSNPIRQPQNLLASSGMLNRNLFPSIPFPIRMIMLNLGGALITSLFLYFMVWLFTTIGNWEGKVVESKQPAVEFGRFHRDLELATLSVAIPSHIYCRLNPATHLDSIFSVIYISIFWF